jgi:hypothetical protein
VRAASCRRWSVNTRGRGRLAILLYLYFICIVSVPIPAWFKSPGSTTTEGVQDEAPGRMQRIRVIIAACAALVHPRGPIQRFSSNPAPQYPCLRKIAACSPPMHAVLELAIGESGNVSGALSG